MTHPLERTRVDPLSDERVPTPALPQIYKVAGTPGTQIAVICLAIDLLLAMASPFVRRSLSSELSQSIALGALYGTLAAQFAMAAIWLGVMATALYWMLVGLVLICLAVLALLPTQVPWPGLLYVVWGGLTFTLPFAMVRMAGLRIEDHPGVVQVEHGSESIRFPLSRLFGWTFVVAAILGVAQWLPVTLAISLATSLSFFGVAVIGLAMLWAVLWPGPLRRLRWLAPIALVAIFVYFGQRAYSFNAADTAGVTTAGLLYILTLAVLLARYRAAGRRLLAGSGRGWLVR